MWGSVVPIMHKALLSAWQFIKTDKLKSFRLDGFHPAYLKEYESEPLTVLQHTLSALCCYFGRKNESIYTAYHTKCYGESYRPATVIAALLELYLYAFYEANQKISFDYKTITDILIDGFDDAVGNIAIDSIFTHGQEGGAAISALLKDQWFMENEYGKAQQAMIKEIWNHLNPSTATANLPLETSFILL